MIESGRRWKVWKCPRPCAILHERLILQSGANTCASVTNMTKNPSRRTVSKRPAENLPAFLFDLDGTLMDSVYQHVLAWREALEIAGIELSVWRIHRRIGMSGGLFVNALLRETGHQVTRDEAAQLQRLHAEAYARLVVQVRPLPGARELLAYLTDAKVPWAIATSGRMESAGPALEILGVDLGKDDGDHERPGPVCEAKSGPYFWRPPISWEWTLARQSWWETAFGICWRPGVPPPSGRLAFRRLRRGRTRKGRCLSGLPGSSRHVAAPG